MADTSETITAQTPDDAGLDFSTLKQEALQRIQELAGEIWTDYNEHDPGVTALEQLCYALTDLSYRAGFPLPDLLTDARTGRVDQHRQALFAGPRIFPCAPVTITDYRKLLLDRVVGLGNVWLEPLRRDSVQGLYRMLLYLPEPNPCAEDEMATPDGIVRETVRQFVSHRALCEDLAGAPLVLEPLPVTMAARVDIDDSDSPERILASILFNVSLYLAPEVKRHPLIRANALRSPPGKLFEGPLMARGLINNDDLQPFRHEIYPQDILRIINTSPGVIGASGLNLCVKGQVEPHQLDTEGPPCPPQPNLPIKVPDGCILQLDTRPDARCHGASLSLYRHGSRVTPDNARVRRELQKRRAEFRQTYDMPAQYRETYPFPTSRRRELARYYSIQSQFPRVYGIGKAGLPADASTQRCAQARQFKGYLLVFEQLLADYLSQLAGVKDLLSIDRDLSHTYFFQYLDRSVPDVAPLLRRHDDEHPGYHEGLPRLIRFNDPVVQRRNRFSNFLLGLYAQDLDAADVWSSDNDTQANDPHLLSARLALLSQTVESSHDRGRGIDYYRLTLPDSMTGMAIKTSIQLGMDPFTHRPLSDVLDESGVDLVEDSDRPGSVSLTRYQDRIEDTFSSPEALEQGDESSLDRGRQLLGDLPLLRRGRLSEEWIAAAASLENFRLGELDDSGRINVVCKSPHQSQWLLAGTFDQANDALCCVYALVELACHIHRHCRQLYIVEHLLLRYALRGEADPVATQLDETAHRRAFQYSFTITAVVSAPARLRDDPSYRDFARRIVRANAPAHIVTELCLLSPALMRRFEHLYWNWRRALEKGHAHERAVSSARLVHFLQHHHGHDRRSSESGNRLDDDRPGFMPTNDPFAGPDDDSI